MAGDVAVKYAGFGVGLGGVVFGFVTAYIQRYGFVHSGAQVTGPYGATLAVALLGMVGAILLLMGRYRIGAWISIATCVLGAFTSLELWLAPGSFFLVAGFIGFTSLGSQSENSSAG